MSTQFHWTRARIMTAIPLIVIVVVFVLVIANLALKGLPAIEQYGLTSLFSTQISTAFSGIFDPSKVGLLPAIWGTVLAVAVSLAVALPIALAMAIFASEFTLGGLGHGMEVLLALFAGVPPIIYALFSIIIAKSFMQIKFSGEGLPEDYIKSLPGLPHWNPGMLPREQSTLLGSLLLGLLIIPFMAPLILDAIRGMPAGLKDASLALGATRWYTLRRVVLPAALTGIVAAISLGGLMVMGEVIISGWAIGIVKDNGMPVPLWDILERNAPLTATGAALVGGFDPAGGGNENPVSYFAGLLLMVMAMLILGLVSLVQKRLQRRFAQ